VVRDDVSVTARPLLGAELPRKKLWFVLPQVALAVLVGVLLASGLRWTALVAVSAVLLLGMTRRLRLVSMLATALLAGALVLDYGFSNLGFRVGAIPFPIPDLLLVLLLLFYVGSSGSRPPLRLVVPILLLLAFVGVRLIVDIPRWGTDALRDSTTALETLALLIGYQAARAEKPDKWVRRFRVILAGVLIYGLAFPWRESLAALGPTVGLQQAVPLLGYVGGATVIAAALFFSVFGRPLTKVLAVSASVVVIAFLQLRGLYVLLPLGFLLLAWCLRRSARTILLIILAGVLGVWGLSFLGSVGYRGRLGPIDASFYSAHVRTLLGESGPGAGSLRHRIVWTESILSDLTDSPATILTGLGLGMDLALGFTSQAGIAVRKPHNDYLEALARLGIVGLLLFTWIVTVPLLDIGRCARRGNEPNSRFCAWAFASCVVYLGMAATQPLLAYSSATIPLFFWLGMGAAAAEAPRKQTMRVGEFADGDLWSPPSGERRETSHPSVGGHPSAKRHW